MQTQKQFAKELKETIKKLIGEEYKVEIYRTEKVNIEKVHALVIFNSEDKVSPTFYIEKFYKKYQQGKATIQEMAESIVHTYQCNTNLFRLQKDFNNGEWMKEHLFLQLINSSKNRKLLQNSVYMDFGEFALVLYVMVSNDEEGLYKLKVTTDMCQRFGWNEKDILNYALENTMHLFPYNVSTLHELLQKAVNSIGIFPDMNIPKVPGAPEITVLTNNVCVNGATAIFYPGVLKEIAEKRGTSLFLLPSSIHEFIIMEDDGICNPEELKYMVQEVNGSAVPPEEVLSDDIYYYGLNSGILSVFKNGKLKKIAMP